MSRNLSQNQREFLDLNYVPRHKRVAHSTSSTPSLGKKADIILLAARKCEKRPAQSCILRQFF